MSTVRNVLAVVGLFTTVRVAVKFFNKHLKEPFESQLAKAFEDEAEESDARQRRDAVVIDRCRQAARGVLVNADASQQVIDQLETAFKNVKTV